MAYSTFTLDKSSFNQTLYASVRDLWFSGVPANATNVGQDAMQRWFGMGDQAQKDAFDEECRNIAGRALESIGPKHLHLPEFVSYEEDARQAREIAGPFLGEIEDMQKEEAKLGADRLVELMLLLDQMPRNVYRTKGTLPLVYRHYDRLSFALLHGALKLKPSPLAHEFYLRRPLYTTWVYMTLLHTEDMASHELWDQLVKKLEAEVRRAGDEDALGFIGKSRAAEEKHLEPLRKFGRYPFRNEALERESTKEEVEWLRTGDSFGVKTGDHGAKDRAAKDEL
jgi:uncharacterized protein (DUF924 family)